MELKTTLMPHQQKAVDKLIGIRVGALYMEMGTGKTRTALEMIKRRMDAGKLDRVLWLCPCSVKENLRADIIKHADGALASIAIAGIESLSGSKRLYAILMRFVQANRVMLVVDESNLVKNHRAIRSQRITAIAEKCPYRLILNGTPISRNEADMYAQWYLLDWRILGYQSFWSFAANHLEYDEHYRGRVRRVLNVDYLTDKIAPYSYMVKKDECLSLPDKHVHTVYFSLTPRQCRAYEKTKEDFLSMLVEDDERIGSAAIYRTFTALQQVTSGRRITSPACERIAHEPFFDDPMENPRLICLHDLIDDDGPKTIIWCKFGHEIDDVSAMLKTRFGEHAVALFHGGLTHKQRMAELERFKSSARFLVANKACAGYGLNLQCCHTAIYYNNDWDWATRAQSEDRLHRLGQESVVEIIDICADRKIDERILQCLSKKENLADWFRREIKGKNTFQWLDGRDECDTNRADCEPEKSGRERVRQAERDQAGGRVLAAALSDHV